VRKERSGGDDALQPPRPRCARRRADQPARASGCGKTTRPADRRGFESPDSATLRRRQPDLRVPAHHAHLGMVFRETTAVPNLTRRKNVDFGLRTAGLPRRAFPPRATTRELCSCRTSQRYPHSCRAASKRVALARAWRCVQGAVLRRALKRLDAKGAHAGDQIRRGPDRGRDHTLSSPNQEEALAIATASESCPAGSASTGHADGGVV